MPKIDLRDEVKRELRRHPRVIHQGLFEEPGARERLAAALPAFIPFKGDGYAAALWVLDWDHRLPSRELMVRLYAFYSEDARRIGVRSLEERLAQISRARISTPSSTCRISPGCWRTRPTRPSCR